MKRPITRLLFLPLLLALPVALAACGGDDDKETLVIAIQPGATQSELTAQAGELEAFLEERIDADVEIRFPTSYGGVIESLRFGHADAAFMGAWPAALATDDAEADVVLAEIRDVIIDDQPAEEPFYFSYWVVPQDSEYETLAELEGKSAAFPSQLSTSGYVAPMARLKELGLVTPDADDAVDPEEFFGEVFYAGGYSQAWEALQAGQVDVSVIAGDVPEELYREVLDNTRVIEQQGPVPSHSVVFSRDLEDPLRSELKDALLELGDDQHRELMRKFISGIFVRFEETTTEEHLGSLNDFLDATGLTFTERLQ
jgi:phosphonate transport system substrate-binding protein